MAFVLAERTRESTATTGTGDLALGGVMAPNQRTFAVGVGVGNETAYALLSGDGIGWEEGYGVLTATAVFQRTTVTKNHLGTTVPIALSGTSRVFSSIPGDWGFLFFKLFGGDITRPALKFDPGTGRWVASAGNRSWHQAVTAATAAALPANTYAAGTAGVGATLTANANGALTVDGVAVAANYRLLIKNELNPLNNGVYDCTQPGDGSHPFILTRSADYDDVSDINQGDTVAVGAAGALNGNTLWVMAVSSQIYGAFWSVSPGLTSVIQNASPGPDTGGPNGWTVLCAAGASPKSTYVVPAAGSPQLNQIRAKAGTASWMGLAFNNTALSEGAFFNLTTGALGAVATGATASIVPDGNGYYLCTLTRADGTNPNFLTIEPHIANSQAPSFTAAGTETILIASAQPGGIFIGKTTSLNWGLLATAHTGYSIGVSIGDAVLTTNQVLAVHCFAKAVTIPTNFGPFNGRTSRAGGTANATASTVISVDRAVAATPNTFTQVGTITIAAAGVVATFATVGAVPIVAQAGDVLRFRGPATADATFAGFYATIVGYET